MRLAALLGPRFWSREAQLAHVLREVPLFRDLPADDLVAIFRHLSQAGVPAGTVICERGDPGDRFYVVKSGTLEVRLGLGPEGVFVRRLVPGNSFGEMALLTGAPRSADIVAAEDAELWVLERRDFDELTTRSVPLLQALNRDLCQRIAGLTLQLEALQEQLGGRGPGSVSGMRFGPYRVVEQLGAGGMAVVYSAVHVETEEAAAIKVLPAAWGEAPELRGRLEREAAVLQHLHHPNVIRILEVGRVEARAGGGCYLAMEWLPHALDRVLRVHYPEPLPVGRALAVTSAVAEGLHDAHSTGIVHRDVKPSNVLLRADGTPVLADFGLITAAAGAEHGVGQHDNGAVGAALFAPLTATNVVVGTADYMSPEQVAGLPLDGRSDVYSLGVMLYEMLVGHVPFAGRMPMETLRAHMEEPPPPLPDHVPSAVRAIVERAVEKLPDDRFSTAAEMAEAVRAAIP